ncbi:MAG: LytR/AlgR family response regulator transcription factor [Vicinamibacterales bacterium]
MSALRVLIVDDEAPARATLRLLLAGRADVTIVGECDDGTTAIAVLRRTSVDLVLLDVEMPGPSGLDVIRALGEAMPPTIFVTAYDRYAIRAFESHALDYLLKPFDDQRFEQVFEAARSRLDDRRVAEWARQLVAAQPPPAPEPPRTLAVEDGATVRLLPLDEIDWLEAADQYVVIHAGGASRLVREPLYGLLERLPSDRFVRIHRSTAVNVARVRELERQPKGDYLVLLKDGTRLRLSRRHRQALEARIGWPL